jgi:hypothetical protein
MFRQNQPLKMLNHKSKLNPATHNNFSMEVHERRVNELKQQLSSIQATMQSVVASDNEFERLYKAKQNVHEDSSDNSESKGSFTFKDSSSSMIESELEISQFS